MFEIEKEMIQGTGKFVQDREKFDKENFEKEKDYSFLGVNFKGLNILFEIERVHYI